MGVSDDRLTELSSRLGNHEQMKRQHQRLRDNLVETQCAARTLELQLKQARVELKKLEGFSVEGLVLGFLGRKADNLAHTREACEELEQQHAECRQSLQMLEREIAGVEEEIGSADAVGDEYESALASRREKIEQRGDEAAERLRSLTDESNAAQASVKAVQGAIAAREETWSDMRSEVEVFSTLGRCRVAEGHKAIGMLMDASRKNTADQSASRVCQSIGRLRRRIGDVASAQDAGARTNLTDLDKRLSDFQNAFAGAGFASCAPDGQSVDDLADVLDDVATALDKRLADANSRAATAEERLRTHIETA
jgi:chromosome segregation ATPase